MSIEDLLAQAGLREDAPRHIMDWSEEDVKKYIQYKEVLNDSLGEHSRRFLYEIKLERLVDVCESKAQDDAMRRIHIVRKRVGEEGTPLPWPDVPRDAGLWQPHQWQEYMALRTQYQEKMEPTQEDRSRRLWLGELLLKIEESQQKYLDDKVMVFRKIPIDLQDPREVLSGSQIPTKEYPHCITDWTVKEAVRFVNYREALERQTPGTPQYFQYKEALETLVAQNEAKAQDIYKTRTKLVNEIIGTAEDPKPWTRMPPDLIRCWESRQAELYVNSRTDYDESILPGENHRLKRFILGMALHKMEEMQAERINEIGAEQARREKQWKELQARLREHIIRNFEMEGAPNQDEIDEAWLEWELDGLTLLATEQVLGEERRERQEQFRTWARRGRMARDSRVVGHVRPYRHQE